MANEVINQRRTRENRYRQAKPKPAAPARIWPGTLIKFMSGAAAIAVMSLVFVFGHDWLTQCNYFRADTVAVSGARRLSDQQIMKAAEITEGVNILSINLATARKRLLALPWIAAAEIRRDFPGAIRIRVKEHAPVAVIDLGRPFLVNAGGEIFMEIKEGQFPDLPVIRGADYRDWKADQSGNTPVSEAVMTVLKLAKSKESAVPADRIERIRVDVELGLTLLTRKTPAERIHLGYGGYARKYQRLSEIFDYYRRNDADPAFAEIDLRYPDRIVARPANASIQIAKGGLG